MGIGVIPSLLADDAEGKDLIADVLYEDGEVMLSD